MKAEINISEAVRDMGFIDPYGFPIPFSLKFLTADRKRNQGGEEMSMKCVVLHNLIPKERYSRPRNNPPRHVAFSDQYNQIYNVAELVYSEANRQYVPTGKIVAVHKWLITEFNKKEIYW